ncbi:coiled-coil domain-containing glutamate-rich protein 1 [Corythoichthys intestinalis]|uniref:coiled-coil domain-containing glutamate-rich protein 1 n=1 Tax=Corythoichthys intestinalis TaxID=161448 RepID=UPI0025A4CE3E|nr:coiled-coil domain-containing glutamate-rich protein 1 [Corythoichthys intestinalis]XP_061814253.1 coiled-coil domain-containing glutamate-rich protein 1 [Nerophis lumbriciformis]
MMLSRETCGREARKGDAQPRGEKRKSSGGLTRGRKKQRQDDLQRPTLLRLRPINVKGNRARGMRAPKNTNQFLMHEKYQMMHMRSDSVGSDTGGSCSDSDSELTDMDSYLGALENARGALPDGPDPAPEPPSGTRQDQEVQHEDSMQYFPSEDDLLQSHNFMQRDFAQFCDFLTS